MTTTTTSEEQETSAPGNSPPKPSKLRDRLRTPVKSQLDEEAAQIDDAVPGDPDAKPQDPAEDVNARKQRFERLGLTKAAKQIREDEDQSVLAWLKSFESDAPIKVAVKRREPKDHIDPSDGQRKKVDGHLRTYDRPIDEVEIQKNHGGGTMQLLVSKRDHTGAFRFLTSKTLEIAGDPRFDDVPRTAAPQSHQQPPVVDTSTNKVVDKVMDHLLAQSRQPPPPQPDIQGAIQAAIQPFIQSQQRMEAQLDRKEQEIREARRGNPEETQFRERLLEKFIDQDSARLQAVRAQYESEIRILKENNIANEARMRDQFQRDKETLDRSHQRELDNLKSANDLKISALEQSFSVQKTVIEAENRRLDRELTELRSEIKELRNKKDPSFKDQLSGIRDMKELISDVMGDDDDKEEKSTLVKVLEGAANSPIIAGFAEKMMAGAAPPPGMIPPQQQQAMPPPQPQRRRGGPRLIRDRRNGQVYATDGVKAIPVVKKPPIAAPAEAAPPPPAVTQVVIDDQGNQTIVEVPPEQPVAEQQQQEPPLPPIPYIEPEKVALAANYMLQAFSNQVPPDDFVTGVKMFIPKEIIAALEQMGPDNFLKRVGGLPDDHPLLTQAGKNWTRRVSKRLME